MIKLKNKSNLETIFGHKFYGSTIGPRIFLAPETEGDGAVLEEEDKDKEPVKKEKPSVSDTEAKLLKEVMEKKNKLKETEKTLEALKNQLSKFEGIDPDEIKNMMADRQKREAEEAEKRGEYERVKNMMAEQHKKDLEALLKKNEETAANLDKARNMINELTIGSSFSSSTFISENLVLTPSKARVIYGNHFEIDDSGKIVAYDKPKGHSDRTKLVNASGETLSFEDAIKKLVESDPDKDKLVKSTAKGGAGSSTDPNAKKEEKPNTGLYGKDRIASILKNPIKK